MVVLACNIIKKTARFTFYRKPCRGNGGCVDRLTGRFMRAYQNIRSAMSVSHIQRGQNPTKSITLKVSEEVPVAV